MTIEIIMLAFLVLCSLGFVTWIAILVWFVRKLEAIKIENEREDNWKWLDR